ncbi:polyphosphate polymerase domain-containing protein [Salinicoccus cyprini]|uniref:Polyphosphate polymerase domain-containing protein n=1 Tax=Salinicoccus cyprini TaxID=2493691 RepID=A0A558AX74_9STAP|nr:polyphosphate polymerase domain-containing protein [Salinicoccus cyprini]TVT28854.1 polyphosphate polymerase domain-containing protein [Salinicoccus cyprini]
MVLEVFNRREVKYLIPFETYESIVQEIMDWMRYDKFGTDGKYNIVSLYFDSADEKIYTETRNKLLFRQKLRLRVYDEADLTSTSFLEIKQKYNNVVNKRRTALPLFEAYDYIYRRNDVSHAVTNPQIYKEVDYFRNLYDLDPKVVVSYDRHAFHGIHEADLRVTFDYNLRCRSDDLNIENGPHGTHFIDRNLVVMEVKMSSSIPLWLTNILSKYGLKKEGVSKFCTSIDVESLGIEHAIQESRVGQR